jgi:hypothetical protein
MKTIFAVACLITSFIFPAYGAIVCPHNSFTCLKRHMNDFYVADHDRFYRVYKEAFDKAMHCRNVQDVTRYLTIYSATGDNAEIDQSMQQDTEALLLLKPTCLFDGASRLTREQRDNFIGRYRLFSRPNHVMQLLHKYMQGGKYKRLATLIYNANLDAYQSYGKAAEDAPMEDLYQQYKR